MHDSMQYDPIHGQGDEPLKVWATASLRCAAAPRIPAAVACARNFVSKIIKIRQLFLKL